MQISNYENLQINSFSTLNKTTGEWIDAPASIARWHTANAAIRLPGQRGFIGRVDHFQKKSIKAIVDAYIKQVVNREGVVGKHHLVIELYRKDENFKTVEQQTIQIVIDNK